MKKTLLLFCLTAMLWALAPGDARATISSLTVTPPVVTVRPNMPAVVRLTWMVRSSGGTTSTVETDDGEIRLAGALVANLPALMPQTKTSAVAVNAFLFTFTDTVTIPASVLREAAQTGKPITFQRAFSNDGFFTQAVTPVNFTLSGGLGGPLTITRIQLSFDDGASICNAKAGDDVTVNARISAEGAGQLRGQWQVRKNATSALFRTIKTVQVPVSAGMNLTLKSPPLPTDDGRFDVRFQVTSPVSTFAEPIVTCALTGNGGGIRKYVSQGRTAELVSPKPFVPLDGSTVIEWKPVDGAKAYRIEVLPGKDSEPVAVQEVKASDTKNKLSPITIDKLDPKRRYMIRVMAQ
ncbi:MAG: fibronectin type III domain-containing protein [Alphaproteobacteria bacterium]|nr:fibronectin type III domain-containing protein [Alphaproteobacteria bacterium]